MLYSTILWWPGTVAFWKNLGSLPLAPALRSTNQTRPSLVEQVWAFQDELQAIESSQPVVYNSDQRQDDDQMEARKVPARKDDRVIVHFDYDCFYASVFEAKNPSLKRLPFAVQQKQIIVTCNYEARRRGLHKLQLITEARRVCPDVIIELGEDISQFRDASKELYAFIKSFTWNNKVERLGFDEVWLDVTDLVDANVETLNRNDLANSFFHTVRNDPTAGFSFDATKVAGHVYGQEHASAGDKDNLALRLRLGSHLALYLRHQLEEQKGYTSTVGIATSRLLSKLVGNLNKPKGQTTLMPPLSATPERASNVNQFMDGHDIGKVPGIGFKIAQKLREFVLQRPAAFDAGLVYGGTKENVTVANVRTCQDVNSESLEKLLAGPGFPHGIGYKIWCLLHGIDDTEVASARDVPRQISVEDSYIRLDTMPEVLGQLTALAKSLLARMRIDLLGTEDDLESIHTANDSNQNMDVARDSQLLGKKWLTHPKTLRLTTRPRQPLQPDGTRVRSFKRISCSGPLPNFVFNLNQGVEILAEKLVREPLIHMFRKLHPEKSGWNLSLVNLAVTNMTETGGDSKTANGRDIESMFRKQEEVLKDLRVTEPVSPSSPSGGTGGEQSSWMDDTLPGALPKENITDQSDNVISDAEDEVTCWDDGDEDDLSLCCTVCGMRMPEFALEAHQRFHTQTTH